MCLGLYDYQSKTSRHRKGFTYLKNRATASQKHTIESQKPERKHKHKRKSSNHKKKGTKKKHRINWKTRFKMAINTYVPIITLNVNGLNAPIKRHRTSLVAQWLRLRAPNAGGPGSIPGQGTRSHMHAATKKPTCRN